MAEQLPSTEEALLGKRASVARGGALWKGEIVAVSDGPAVLVEQPNGDRVMVNLDGAEIALIDNDALLRGLPPLREQDDVVSVDKARPID